MTYRQSVFCSTSGRRRQFRYQPQRYCQFIELEVRPEESDRFVNSRLARHLGDFNACFFKRMSSLNLRSHLVVTHYILVDPLIEKGFALAARHKAADLVAHHGFYVMRKA